MSTKINVNLENAIYLSLLQLLILSHKHILGVKKEVRDGFRGGLDVVWGVLWWFGVFPRTVTGRIFSQKIFSSDVNLNFIV